MNPPSSHGSASLRLNSRPRGPSAHLGAGGQGGAVEKPGLAGCPVAALDAALDEPAGNLDPDLFLFRLHGFSSFPMIRGPCREAQTEKWWRAAARTAEHHRWGYAGLKVPSRGCIAPCSPIRWEGTSGLNLGLFVSVPESSRLPRGATMVGEGPGGRWPRRPSSTEPVEFGTAVSWRRGGTGNRGGHIPHGGSGSPVRRAV